VLKIVSESELKAMRSLDELHQHLPASVNGVTIRRYQGPELDVLRQRTGIVRSTSNTPAMGAIAKRYSPFAIDRVSTERLAKHPERDYDPELQHFDGMKDGKPIWAVKARGYIAPFNLLDQVLTMAPQGDSFKRGPTPIPWNVHQKAVETVIIKLHAAGVKELDAAHMVLCTEDSTGDGVPFAMLKDKSAAMPFVLNKERKPQKGKWIKEAAELGKRILDKAHRGLLFWPAVVYKRYDRPAPIEFFSDDEKAKSMINLYAKDRAIMAMPYPHQVTEGTMLRPVQIAIQKSSVSEIDVRTPYHTANVLEDLGNWVQHGAGSNNRYTIGVDESGWDHHMTPQGWYAAFQILRALMKPTHRIGVIECEEFVIFDRRTQSQLERIAPGNTTTFRVRTRVTKADGTAEERTCDAKASMYEIDTDTYLC